MLTVRYNNRINTPNIPKKDYKLFSLLDLCEAQAAKKGHLEYFQICMPHFIVASCQRYHKIHYITTHQEINDGRKVLLRTIDD